MDIFGYCVACRQMATGPEKRDPKKNQITPTHPVLLLCVDVLLEAFPVSLLSLSLFNQQPVSSPPPLIKSLAVPSGYQSKNVLRLPI